MRVINVEIMTLEWAEELNRLFFQLELENINKPDDESIQAAGVWMASREIETLNVAGNRESTSPGIADNTILILEKLYGMQEQR